MMSLIDYINLKKHKMDIYQYETIAVIHYKTYWFPFYKTTSIKKMIESTLEEYSDFEKKSLNDEN